MFTVLKLYIFASMSIACVQNATAISYSFFAPRTFSTQSIYELSLIDYDIFLSESDRVFYASIKPFGAESTNRTALGKYCLPCNKNPITLDESGFGDVNP